MVPLGVTYEYEKYSKTDFHQVSRIYLISKSVADFTLAGVKFTGSTVSELTNELVDHPYPH